MNKRFRVALSFPGEARDYVKSVALHLERVISREKIFYDEWYKSELARPNLDLYLQNIYHQDSELLVPFFCIDYQKKEWCGLEWRAIRDLIKQKRDADIMPMHFDNSKIDGIFSIDGYINIQNIKPEETASYILERLQNSLLSNQPDKHSHQRNIYSDRLPTTSGNFIGRAKEIESLGHACEDNEVRVIQFVAPGGTGKTKLIRHWLDNKADIGTLIAWSFYSQGASENKQISASPFFDHVFDLLDIEKKEYKSEEDLGHHLADELVKYNFILVLDGLEPLQHVGRGMRGEIKDRALKAFINSLLRSHKGLCIVTSRIKVLELTDRNHTVSYELKNLEPHEGVSLLKSLGVSGSYSSLLTAVNNFSGHALALSLLGNAVATFLEGDIRKIDTIPSLTSEFDSESSHAFRVMRAYEEWLTNNNDLPTPELQLLYILGLFDRPIELNIIKMLWQDIESGLMAGTNENEWKVAIRDLENRLHLISKSSQYPVVLDCHPLLREYFGRQCREKYPEDWKSLNIKLFEYYRKQPQILYGKKIPDTLEEMRPVFDAISHACAAKEFEKAHEEYWERILRKSEFYVWTKLGASIEHLACMANFFERPWSKLDPNIGEGRGILFNWAGMGLRSLSRLDEAKEVYLTSVKEFISEENWYGVSQGLNHASEAALILGHLPESLKYAKQAVSYADKAKYVGNILALSTANLAYLQFMCGRTEEATITFEESIKIGRSKEAKKPNHYNLTFERPVNTYTLDVRSQYYYFSVLLETEQYQKAKRIALYLWDVSLEKEKDLLKVALIHLMICRLILLDYIELKYFKVDDFFSEMVEHFRSSGFSVYLLNGLIARSKLYSSLGKFVSAEEDLNEVYELASNGKMQLLLIDYHLEYARLLLIKNSSELSEVRFEIEEASKLISKTKCPVKTKELHELTAKLQSL